MTVHRRHAKPLLALLVAASASAAAGQEAAPLLPSDPRAPRYHEIERGAFAGLEAGWLGFLKTPTADKGRFPAAGNGGGLSSGLALGLLAGVDLGPRLAVSALFFGAEEEARVSYGAFSLLGVGGDVQFALLGWSDSQNVKRTTLYVHARGAWFMTDPHGLFGKTDVLVGGGPGIAYETRLRHFSVGLALDGVIALQAKAPGIAVTPTIRYTF